MHIESGLPAGYSTLAPPPQVRTPATNSFVLTSRTESKIRHFSDINLTPPPSRSGTRHLAASAIRLATTQDFASKFRWGQFFFWSAHGQFSRGSQTPAVVHLKPKSKTKCKMVETSNSKSQNKQQNTSYTTP